MHLPVPAGLTIFLGLAFFLLSACGTEVNSGGELNESFIEGEWEVVYALRGGSPTTTLDGAVFTFENGIFSSNIPDVGTGGNYEIDGETIYTGLRNPEQFEVVSFSEDRLTLSTRISGFEFELELERSGSNEEHLLQ